MPGQHTREFALNASMPLGFDRLLGVPGGGQEDCALAAQFAHRTGHGGRDRRRMFAKRARRGPRPGDIANAGAGKAAVKDDHWIDSFGARVGNQLAEFVIAPPTRIFGLDSNR
jgi:hypothetical protein